MSKSFFKERNEMIKKLGPFVSLLFRTFYTKEEIEIIKRKKHCIEKKQPEHSCSCSQTTMFAIATLVMDMQLAQQTSFRPQFQSDYSSRHATATGKTTINNYTKKSTTIILHKIKY